MIIISWIVLLLIVAYLLGSIPTAVWMGKIIHGVDVREFGSGNAGATNTIRVLGWKTGVPVLLLDVFKGYLAVSLLSFFSTTWDFLTIDQFSIFQLALGTFAMLGHIFPVFANFKGGKGVATLLGVMFAVMPYAAILASGVFLIIFFITRYVSLGSITAAVVFPFIVIFVFNTNIKSLIIFSFFISILIVLTHRKNIQRLVRREENKINFKKKKDI